ncbi:MAG: manganese efflux pump [Clostridia bacterium]|nr:manganese efflux pump [Clostridia bacterium]
MDLLSVLLIAVGLSMDAFAVSICKGLAMRRITLKNAAVVGAWFGAFQGLMPFTGYLLGVQFERFVNAIAPWVAFALLSLIGANMLREAFSGEEKPEEETATLHPREMLMLAVATSIDALAVGISYAMVPVSVLAASEMANTLLACALTAATTCLISMAGVRIGSVFGARYKKGAEITGGVILILIGVEILLRHFGVI